MKCIVCGKPYDENFVDKGSTGRPLCSKDCLNIYYDKYIRRETRHATKCSSINNREYHTNWQRNNKDKMKAYTKKYLEKKRRQNGLGKICTIS